MSALSLTVAAAAWSMAPKVCGSTFIKSGTWGVNALGGANPFSCSSRTNAVISSATFALSPGLALLMRLWTSFERTTSFTSRSAIASSISPPSAIAARTAQLLCFKLRRRPSIRHRRPPPLIRPRITHDPAGIRKVALPDKPFTRAAMVSPTPGRRRRPRTKPHRMDVRRPVVRVERPHVIMIIWHSDSIVLRM